MKITMLTRRVEVDRRVCQAFGACFELYSESFYLSEEDSKAKLIDDPPVYANEVINLKRIFDDLMSNGLVESVYPFIAKG